MKLDDIRDAYIAEGVPYLEAMSRTSQDVILSLISKSTLAQNVTIKGDVVMRHISGDSRRSTQDLDFDLIKYPISDGAIRDFIEKLYLQRNDISISIIAPIEELKHRDYNGKRVYIRIIDSYGTSIDTKLDIGIHRNIELEQKEYCFDLGKLNDRVTLLANTKEQIFAEKLKSLLRLGAATTRYKDIFDMYYLAVHGEMMKKDVRMNLKVYIFDDRTMRERNAKDILARLDKVLSDPRFRVPFGKTKRYNWLEVDPARVVQCLLDYFK